MRTLEAGSYLWLWVQNIGWDFLCGCKPGADGQRTASTLMERELEARAQFEQAPQWGRVIYWSEVAGDDSEAGNMLFMVPGPGYRALHYWFPRGTRPDWSVFSQQTSGPEDALSSAPPLDPPGEGWGLENSANATSSTHTGAPMDPAQREKLLRDGLARAEGWGPGKLRPLPGSRAPASRSPGKLPPMKRTGSGAPPAARSTNLRELPPRRVR